jgi:hypothetical protein
LQGFYDFLAILHGVILAEHAIFIGFYTFSRTTNYAPAQMADCPFMGKAFPIIGAAAD